MVPWKQQGQVAVEYQNDVNGLAKDLCYLCLLVAKKTVYFMLSLSCLQLGFQDKTVQGHFSELMLYLSSKESNQSLGHAKKL